MTGAGDARFEALYRELYPMVVRTVYLVIFDREVAADITHEAFLRLWQRRDRMAENSNEKAWLMKVAVNLAIDHQRSLLTALKHRLMPAPPADPAATALSHLDHEQMKKAVRKLPARDRAVLALRFEQDLSFPEISKILGEPDATLRTRVHRALERLHIQLGGPDAEWIAEKA